MKQFRPKNRLFCSFFILQNSRFLGILVCAPFLSHMGCLTSSVAAESIFYRGCFTSNRMTFFRSKVTADGSQPRTAELKRMNFYSSLPSF